MSATAGSATRPALARPPATTSGLRTDIQGLRALAVALVLAFHLWPDRLTGGYVGVDVFFVISGFLITSHLLQSPPAGARDLLRFWSRRVRRLLPASLLVLAATLAATRLVAPETQWGATAREARAATLYVVNWVLASQSVDYLAAENAPSPVQHFWSLSVEEQFYLGWPVLIAVLAWSAARAGTRVSATVSSGLALTVVVSLGYSVYLTATEPARAYFVTPTRIWELGVGGLLAAALSRRAFGRRADDEAVPLPAGARVAMSWAGLLAVGLAAVAYTPETAFPGWRALLPVLGTAAVVAACAPWTRGSPAGLLALPPVQWLGDVSYSVYLWHWPLVVLLPYATGHDLTFLDSLSVVMATLGLAGLTKRYVEDRFRTEAWGRPLRKPFLLAAAGMAVVLLLAGALSSAYHQRQSEARESLTKALAGDDPCLGAAALADAGRCGRTTTGPVLPAPAQAAVDRSDAYDGPCWTWKPFTETRTCTFGDPAGEVSIAVVGNSHAGQWLPALQRVAGPRGWRIDTYLATECTGSRTPVQWETAALTDACLGWADRVQEATVAGGYDLVVASDRNGRAPSGLEDADRDDRLAAYEEGYRDYLAGWVDAGVPVLVLHDTPFPASSLGNVPDCVAEHEDDLTVCSGSRDSWVPDDPQVDAARGLDTELVTTADLTEHLCGPDTCDGVVGGVVAYFDGSHVSATYMETLAPYLRPALLHALGSGR